MNRMPKLLLAWMLAALLAAALPATAAPPQTETPNQRKIALVMKALSNPFFFKMEAGAKAYASEHGLSLEVFGTEMETDIEHQAGIINNLIARSYGAIVIAPADSRKLIPILNKAASQGIVIINIDNPLDQDAQAQYGISIPFVGSDNAKGAALVGNYIRTKLKGKGKVLVIEGIRGAKNSELRKTGFIQALTSGNAIEVIDTVSGNWQTEDAFTAVSALLEKNKDINAIFCANDQMALGALRALDLRQLTGKVWVGGYDNIDEVHNELRNGRMHATVEQHPELMGRYGVELAHRSMQGQKIPTYQETPLDLVAHESFGKRIALALSDSQNPFFTSLLQGARTQAAMHGVELSEADASNDDAQQLVALRGFVDNRVDLLIVNPTNAQTVRPGIELANRARIPVITVDRQADGGRVLAHVASDNIAGGRLAGAYLASRLDSGGTVAEFEGIPGTSASYERGKGFNEALARNHKLRVAVREVANFDRDSARDSMTRLLAEGRQFDAIFAHNDSMILGVMDALQTAKPAHYPLLVGFDAIPEARQAVRDGRISATIAQKPERMGALAVDLAVAALRQETVPANVLVELDLITTSGR